MNEGRLWRHPGTLLLSCHTDPLLGRIISITIVANANLCQSKISKLKFACVNADISVDLQTQMLRLAGTQGLVPTFEFIPLSAEPGRRPDGRAVLAPDRDVRRDAADV